jgi:hypothetical protein
METWDEFFYSLCFYYSLHTKVMYNGTLHDNMPAWLILPHGSNGLVNTDFKNYHYTKINYTFLIKIGLMSIGTK